MTNRPLTKYTILTHNVQGINSPTKRAKAFQQYHKMGVDVLLLQEMHFSKASAPRYLNARYTTAYLSNGPDKKRGVAICFAKKVPFTPTTVIRDKEGRYIMVVGKINESEVTFLSYYAPNVGQLTFFRSMLEIIMPHVAGHVILGGDSNTSLDRVLDRSNPGKAILKHATRQRGAMARLLHSYDLIDVWRDAHSTDRDFTYYSHVHKTYSRIDHVFTFSPLLSFVSSAMILPMSWSDHSSVQIVLTDLWANSSPPSWRLNESLLNDPAFEKEIERAIKQFFEENSSSVSSPVTLWAAHKATMRGTLIQLASKVKRERERTIRQQEEELRRVMREQKSNPHLDFRTQIDDVRTALNLSLTT